MSEREDPVTPLATLLLSGQEAMEAGRFDDAARAFEAVRALLPQDVGVALLLANALTLADRPLAARATLEQAAHGGAWQAPATAHALAAALISAGAPRTALPVAEHVATRLPDDPAALGALAAVHRLLGAPERAWPLVERALQRAPRLPALLVTAGQVRHDLGDLAGADRFYERAEAVRPGHAPTQVLRAYTALMAGASTRGWALFDARPLPAPATTARSWRGEPLEGGSIFVTAEQGVGDQFQFVRFVRLLAERGAGRIITACHPDAVTLLRANGFDAVPRSEQPVTDWHVPMLSLPYRLELDHRVRGDQVPYLRAPAPVTVPRRDARPQVGLVWAGNPAFPGGVTRDLDPRCLDALLAIDSVQWWSLQFGALGDVTRAGLERVPPPTSWQDTANWLAGLDGLVTTDTGIAHLAGAMGVRTWVMLQHVPDWRWGLEGTRTPWYPSVTLVRPAQWNGWAHVVAQLQEALSSFTSAHQT